MLRYTLRQLEYLVAVAEEGSISAAADRVNVSPPSISVAIGQIETQLGLALFVRRQAQGLSLTQAGRQIVEQAQHVLAEAERLNSLAARISGQVRGTLHVGCMLTFAQVVLPQLRRGFVVSFPDVVFRQSEEHQSNLIHGLRRGRLDVVLTYDLEIPPDLSFVPLASLPPHALMSPDHPLAGRSQVTAEDLAPYPMVLLDLPLSSDYFMSAFAKVRQRPNIVERSKDMAVVRSLVANGFGYSIANMRPETDFAPDGKRLCFVPLVESIRPTVVGLLLAEGAEAVLTIRAFVDHCRAAVQAGGVPGLRNVQPVPRNNGSISAKSSA
jgi:DNA-binding transcriptional LysR family regulator